MATTGTIFQPGAFDSLDHRHKRVHIDNPEQPPPPPFHVSEEWIKMERLTQEAKNMVELMQRHGLYLKSIGKYNNATLWQWGYDRFVARRSAQGNPIDETTKEAFHCAWPIVKAIVAETPIVAPPPSVEQELPQRRSKIPSNAIPEQYGLTEEQIKQRIAEMLAEAELRIQKIPSTKLSTLRSHFTNRAQAASVSDPQAFPLFQFAWRQVAKILSEKTHPAMQ